MLSDDEARAISTFAGHQSSIKKSDDDEVRESNRQKIAAWKERTGTDFHAWKRKDRPVFRAPKTLNPVDDRIIDDVLANNHGKCHVIGEWKMPGGSGKVRGKGSLSAISKLVAGRAEVPNSRTDAELAEAHMKAQAATTRAGRFLPGLKGSIGEGPNHSNEFFQIRNFP